MTFKTWGAKRATNPCTIMERKTWTILQRCETNVYKRKDDHWERVKNKLSMKQRFISVTLTYSTMDVDIQITACLIDELRVKTFAL